MFGNTIRGLSRNGVKNYSNIAMFHRRIHDNGLARNADKGVFERDPFRLPARPAKRFQCSLARASARSWLAQWSPFPSPSILPDRSSPSRVTPR